MYMKNQTYFDISRCEPLKPGEYLSLLELTVETDLLGTELMAVKADVEANTDERPDDNVDDDDTCWGELLLRGKFSCSTVAAGEVERPWVLPENGK